MRTVQSSAVSRASSSSKVCCRGMAIRPAAVSRTHRQRASVSAAAAAASKGPSGLSWQAEDVETLLDGRIDKCDLVEAFSRAAINQQGRPREDVHCYMEPPSATNSKTAAAAAAAPSFPPWCELMQSIDSTDVIDWSDVENDGWGVAAEQQRGSTGSSGGWDSSSSSSPLPPAAAAAAVGSRSGCRGALWSGSALNSSTTKRQGLLLWGSRTGMRRAVAMRATPAGKQAQTETDDAPHYEGADSDLFPAGGLEMDDPGHPTDIAGAGKDTQSAVVRPEAKPYMNIKNGRWVPPSKVEAEDMMKHQANMGTDEGV